jgi:membrane protease YdiL (CAAX protease family)
MTDRKKNALFIVSTYAIFWMELTLFGILLFGGIVPQNETVMLLVKIVFAWAPTLAVLLWRKKLLPGGSVKQFYKSVFTARLNAKLLLCVTAVQILALLLASGGIAIMQKLNYASLFDLSLPSIGMGLLSSVFSGATGEESGWRGFLQRSFEKKSGVIKSSLMIGVIWTLWHTPLWFLTSGFAGMELVQYIVFFALGNISAAVVIGICYRRCRNLFVPVWIHFLFNFFANISTAPLLETFTLHNILYAVIAVVYGIWHVQKARSNNIRHNNLEVTR